MNRFFILSIGIFISSMSICYGVLPEGRVPVATISTYKKPVKINLPSGHITLLPRSVIVLDLDGKSKGLKPDTLLTGSAFIRGNSNSENSNFVVSDVFLTPGNTPDYIGVFSQYRSLYPSIPFVIAADSNEGCIFHYGGTPSLLKNHDYATYQGKVFTLRNQYVEETYSDSLKDVVCEATFTGSVDDLLSIKTSNGKFRFRRSVRFPVVFNSNNVLHKEMIDFPSDSVSVSLDGNDPYSRQVTVLFGGSNGSSSTKNRLRTGPGAGLKFSIYGDYHIILSPSTFIEVELSTTGISGPLTAIRIARGSLLIWPDTSKSDSTESAAVAMATQPPVKVEGKILHSSKHGRGTFISVKKDGYTDLDPLLSLSGDEVLRKEAGVQVGHAEIKWAQFVEKNQKESEVPWSRVSDTLEEVARAREKTIPLFTMISPLPATRSDLFEGLTMNVDGNNLEEQVYVEVHGKPDEDFTAPEFVSNYLPRQDHNIVDVLSAKGNLPLMTVDFFRPFGKPRAKKKGRLSFSLYSYFSKNTKVSKNFKAIKPSQVTRYKVAYDFVVTQYEKHPYKVICVVIFLLALLIYVLATVPVLVISSAWYLIGYIRGEPCKVCKMPLEKEYLPPLPLDIHLAMTSRLASYSMTPELAGIEKKVHKALAISRDVDPKRCKTLPMYVEGDCVWCLRCSKGQLRFRVVHHGNEIETGYHQLDHPGMLEFVKRWYEQNK